MKGTIQLRNIQRELSFLTYLSMVLIFSLFLSGCGSSSKGSESDSIPKQEVRYQGKMTIARLTSDNAKLFFAEIMGSGTGATALKKHSANKETGAGSPVNTFISLVTTHIQETQFYSPQALLKQGTGRLSKSIKESTTCEKGSVSTDGEIDNNGIGTLRLIFINCQEDGKTLNGTTNIKVREVDSATGKLTDFIITFDVLNFQDATSYYSIGGSLHDFVYLDVGYEKVEAELTVVDHLFNKTFKMENWTMILTYNNILNPTNYTETFSGRFYDSEEGYVDVVVDSYAQYYYSDNAPLYYSDLTQDFPERGGPILLSGDGGTGARLTILSLLSEPVKVLLEVDTNGDSFYEPGNIYAWEGLISSATENLLPMVGGVEIQPENPRTTDTLTAYIAGGVLDLNGDSITTTFAWLKNGELISGQTGDTLSSGHYVKGDVITVRAIVFDGTDTVTVESDPVTILGGPPILEFLSPVSVVFGETVHLEAKAVDPDGDPVTYALLYGPSGMVVDPATGELSWRASEPMFDQTLNVQFRVSASADGEMVTASGTIIVTDTDRQHPLTRTGNNIPVHADGIRIADFKGNGHPEILMTDHRNLLYTLVWSGTGYAQNWVFPFDLTNGGSITAIEVHDVTRDGRPDFIVGVRKKIIVLDGVSRKIIREISDDYNYHYAIRVADIDGDMELEMVYLGSNVDLWSDKFTINIYDIERMSFDWQSPEMNLGSSLAIGNVDKDSALEIVTAKGYVYDGLTYQNEWAYGPGFGFLVDTGDLDNDGIDEIIGVVNWGGATIFGAVLKSPLKEIKPDKEGIGSLVVANIDNDPQEEVILGNGQWGDVMAYDGFTGGLEWKTDSQDCGVSDIAIGDTDGDSEIEIVWASGIESSGSDALVVAGFHPDIAVEWSNETINTWGWIEPFQLGGPFVGGRWLQTETGLHEAVFASVSTNSGYGGTRLIRIDPVTGLMLWGVEVGANWNKEASLDGADYDNDGIDEVFLTTSDTYDGYFTVYDMGMDRAEWTSGKGGGGVGVAVTHGDMNGDGNSDMVVVTREGYIFIYDAFNSILLWKSTKLSGNGIDVEVVDLDGDGVLEVSLLTDQVLAVYERFGEDYIQRSLKMVSGGVALAIANLDGEMGSEIVMATKPSLYSNRGSVEILKGKDLGQKYNYSVFESITDIAITPENGLLLAVMKTSDYWPYEHHSKILRIDPFTGIEIWRTPDLLGAIQPNSISFADTDGDGSSEMIIGTSSAMYLTR